MKNSNKHNSAEPQSSATLAQHYPDQHPNVKKLSTTSDIIGVRQRTPHAQQPSWFAVLRARLSQLTMPDWLSQLGIGAASQNHHLSQHPEEQRNHQSARLRVESLPICEDPESTECPQGVDSNPQSPYDTLSKICDRHTVSLEESEEDGAEESTLDWTIDSSIFNETSETSDTLKVQHFGPLNDLTLERQDPGRGHSFSDLSLSNPTWCDKCGDFMWGFLTAAVKCDNCNYTCHEKCKSLVTLDCKTYESTVKSTSSEDSTFKKVPSLYPNLQVVESEESVAPLGAEKAPIESDSDKKCVGFIQIHMNFTRPINVVAGETFPSVFDVSGTASTCGSRRTISSFFLPRNTVKTVNISSEMKTREMIVTLLRKFKVADNPRKFSLYERTCETNEENTGGNELVRVPDDAYPLRIAHSWMKLNLHKQFVLQENDTGDILWEMFEVPELENFLRILAIEEKQYLFRIRQKYRSYIWKINQQLQFRGLEVESIEGFEGTSV